MSEEYTREKIKETVFVPASVESDIKTEIENRLKRCGIFYRVFSRRKSAASLEHKLSSGRYGEHKKIQDLIGVRVNLYFQDDLDICKEIFEDVFELVDGEWSENEMNNKNFEATKINGVFKLPEELEKKVKKSTWTLPIDKTFEIQLKTVFFEGWHEVEHDFRYKMNEGNEGKKTNIWDEYPSFSRQFNSVVATLELCDRSMVTMFDKFAHKLYKDSMWDMMIRMHFRIRISDQPLYEGLAEILEADEKALGKALFRTDRKLLITKLQTLYREVPISVNMIIALLNKDRLGDNEIINDIMRERKVYKDGLPEIEKSYEQRELLPLSGHYVFKNKIFVKADKKNQLTVDDVYERITGYLYGWTRDKFRPIFQDLPDHMCQYEKMLPGYQVKFNTWPEELKLSMETSHVARDVGARMWNTEAEIKPNDKRTGLWVEIKNLMYDGREISEMERVSRFSFPNFYRSLFEDKELTLYDVQPYGDKVYGLRKETDIQLLTDLIQSEERQTPVVVMASDVNEDNPGFMDESWIGTWWLNNLNNQVKYYAHVYRCDVEKLKLIMQDIDGENECNRGVYIFYPKRQEVAQEGCSTYRYYDENEINDCAYNKWKGDGAGIRKDKVQDGATAFLFMLVDEIKKWVIKE